MPVRGPACTLLILLLCSPLAATDSKNGIEIFAKEFTIGQFEFSPDNTWLATCGKTDSGLRNDVAYVWNTADGSLIRELIISERRGGHTDQIRAIINPNGTQIWLVNDAHSSQPATIWNTKQWTHFNHDQPKLNTRYPAFVPSGKLAILASRVSVPIYGYPIIDTQSFSIATLIPVRGQNSQKDVRNVRLVDENLLIAQRGEKGSLESWSIKPTKQVCDIRDDERVFQNWKLIGFGPKTRLLTAVQNQGKTIVQIRDPKTGDVAHSYADEFKGVLDEKHGNTPVIRVGYSRRETSNQKGKITHHLLNRLSGQLSQIKVFHIHYGNSLTTPAFAASNDGSLVAFEAWTATKYRVQREIAVHRVDSGDEIASFPVGEEEIVEQVPPEKNDGRLSNEGRMLKFSPDGSHLAYRYSKNSTEREASKNLFVRIWKLPE